MDEHDDDLQIEPELQELLRDLDYTDDGPSPELRARTLGAVRALPDHRAAAHTAVRRSRRPYAIGGIAAVAAAALAALVFTLGGLEGDADRTVQLTGSAGTVTAEIQDAEVSLKGSGEKLPAGTTYELWAIQDGTPRSAGTFTTDDDGRIDAELMLPKGAPQNAPLAITSEDDDDPAPSLPPVMASPV
ncbi:MAG: anti-sigma factor [Solirubrobacteraceae bacterium]|nr:anti-sigma factor [Solirubrobacteraceae bacterium]